MGRGYVDYAWLFNLYSCGVTFVTRLKSNADIAVAESFLTDTRRAHILSDEDIVLAGYSSKKAYPKPLRVVKVQDPVNDQTLYLLTNQMSWTADSDLNNVRTLDVSGLNYGIYLGIPVFQAIGVPAGKPVFLKVVGHIMGRYAG